MPQRIIILLLLALAPLPRCLLAEEEEVETLPLPAAGTWIRYQIAIPEQVPVEEAYRPETPALPAVRAPKEKDGEKKDQEVKKEEATEPAPTPMRVFSLMIRILETDGRTAEMLIEIGEKSHVIRQRIRGAQIPLLPEATANLMHLPSTAEETVQVGETSVQATVTRWIDRDDQLGVWRSDVVPFGLVRLALRDFELKVIEWGREGVAETNPPGMPSTNTLDTEGSDG